MKILVTILLLTIAGPVLALTEEVVPIPEENVNLGSAAMAARSENGTEIAVVYSYDNEEAGTSKIYATTFSKKTQTWSNTTLLQGISGLTALSLDVKPLKDAWVIAWTTQHISDGTFNGYEYHIVVLTKKAGIRETVNLSATPPKNSMLDIIPYADDGFFVLYQGEQTLQIRPWQVGRGWQEEPTGLANMTTAQSYQVLTQGDKIYLFGENSQRIYYRTFDGQHGWLKRKLVAKKAELQDVLINNEGIVHLVYSQDSKIYHQTIGQDGLLTDNEIVWQDIDCNDCSAITAYSEYGQGQYIILLQSKVGSQIQLSYAIWRPTRGWEENQFMSTAAKHVMINSVRIHHNGNIQLIYKIGDQYYVVSYVASTGLWADASTIPTFQDDLIWKGPSSGIQSDITQGYIDRFRRHAALPQQVLKRWNMAQSGNSTAQTYDLPYIDLTLSLRTQYRQ